jgi:RNA polymerase sigma-70 factor, ECF subfamily
MEAARSTEDALYREAAATYGAALERLARVYEADPELRRDLLQEIHVALWRSFRGFDGRCSLRTWIYRVANNAATSYVIRQRRVKAQMLVGVEELERIPDGTETENAAQQEQVLERLFAMIYRLQPLDRQVMLAYLEGMDAASIAEITGLSARNVATKIHRTKRLLRRRFEGATDEE